MRRYEASKLILLFLWRKAGIGYDEVEIVTDVEKVIDLHNRYFSPVWADLSKYGDTITIGESMIDGSAA